MEGDAKTSTTAGALSVPEAGTLVCPVTNWLINSFSMMRETIPSLFKSFKPCPGGGVVRYLCPYATDQYPQLAFIMCHQMLAFCLNSVIINVINFCHK
jgi:hypothetical protein